MHVVCCGYFLFQYHDKDEFVFPFLLINANVSFNTIDYAFQVPCHERGCACRHHHDGPRWVHTTATHTTVLPVGDDQTTGQKNSFRGPYSNSFLYFCFFFCNVAMWPTPKTIFVLYVCLCASFGDCGTLHSAHVGAVGSFSVDGRRCSVHSEKLPIDGNIGRQWLCSIDRLQVKLVL